MVIRLYTLLFAIAFIIYPTFSQVFVEKQTRHRFAQNSMGFDFQNGVGGHTFFQNRNGQVEKLDINGTTVPRIVLGGLHFWGHADFYIAIPLRVSSFESNNQEITYSSGVETVFKYYPWQLESKKIRPYIGLSVTPYRYKQDNFNLEFSGGQNLYHVSVPLMSGITYLRNNKQFELGVTWNYNNEQEYYLNRTDIRSISTNPLYITAALKFVFDTTIGLEEAWESGRQQEKTKKLAEQGELNGFFIGAGLSSAWWMGESTYNTNTRPFIQGYGNSIMGDFAIGYYLHNPDINIAVNYRKYGKSIDVYGAFHSLKRRSYGLEATKYITDYNGFDAFIGPIITYEKLNFSESFERNLTQKKELTQINWGITFGWDIRPDRMQTIILRTSLRWFPSLNLDIDDSSSISFENIEFNFIQLVIFPNRF